MLIQCIQALKIYQPGGLSYDNVGEYLGKSAPIPYPYEFFVIKGDSHENHLSYYDPNKGCILKIPESCKDVYKSAVHTRSYEQEFAMWALLNPDIKLVTLSGIAGTGKTMLAIAAAIRQKDAYSQIMLSKPIVGVSDKDIGFLPGDAEDKVAPFMQSFYDQMNFLDRVANSNVGKSEIAGLKESKQLEIVPLVYIRGRSFPGTFLIVDEAQNLNPTEAKAFVTRLDEQSKVVLIGDTGQIDSRYLNKSNNGLSVTIQAFRDCDFAASITLHKVERSHLADWAATHM